MLGESEHTVKRPPRDNHETHEKIRKVVPFVCFVYLVVLSSAGISVLLIHSFGGIRTLANRPKQPGRFACGIGLEFDLKVGRFGEEFLRRLGKENKADITHGGDELAFLG